MENRPAMNNPDTWVNAVHSQFEAAITALEKALLACPQNLWEAPMWHDTDIEERFSRFWYVAYHTLFYLDLYLFGSVEGFRPPTPFTLDELDPAGVFPARTYTRQELLDYLNYCRSKCRSIFAAMTAETAQKRCKFPWMELDYADLLLDNMRHVQEHAAQMNLFLGQQSGIHSDWVSG